MGHVSTILLKTCRFSVFKYEVDLCTSLQRFSKSMFRCDSAVSETKSSLLVGTSNVGKRILVMSERNSLTSRRAYFNASGSRTECFAICSETVANVYDERIKMLVPETSRTAQFAIGKKCDKNMRVWQKAGSKRICNSWHSF